MMRNKKMALALALCACLLLTGCQFAKEEVAAREDTPVGVSLRLRQMNDHADTDGGTAAMPLEAPLEWASERPVGDRYYYINQSTNENGDEYTGFEQENWPGTVKNHMSISDTEEKYESDAVVYITGAPFRDDNAAADECVLEIDTIFRRADGTLYCKSDAGSLSGHIDGSSREIKYESSATDTGGVKKSFAVRSKVTIEYVIELETACICAFDASGALLGCSALGWQSAGDELRYVIPDGAAYLILEETGVNIRGERETARTLCNLPAQNDILFTLRLPDGTGFADPLPVEAAK